jgi:hypothetical protein
MRARAAILLIGALALAGCQSDPFTDATGSVTLDGAPLAEGEIIFVSPDNSTTPSAGEVKDGQFKCRVTPGAKKVQINATRDTGRKEADGWAIRESIVPEKYNTKTELTADVKPKGPNEFKFELKSKP